MKDVVQGRSFPRQKLPNAREPNASREGYQTRPRPIAAATEGHCHRAALPCRRPRLGTEVKGLESGLG